MKKSSIFPAILFAGTVFFACNKDNSTVTPSQTLAHSGNSAHRLPHVENEIYSQFISTSDANSMISSYLTSIDYTHNDTDVRAFIVNADSLRAYLSDPSVKGVKIILAHTEAFVNSYAGENAGYQAGGLTLVIAGFDSVGNYKYHNGKVLDHVGPCPYTCPVGTAGDPLLY